MRTSRVGLVDPGQGLVTGLGSRTAREVVEELFERQRAADETVLDDLVAADLVNHARDPRAARGCARFFGPSRSTWGRPSSSSTTWSVKGTSWCST